MHPTLTISVVYPTCGRPELLLRSLAALLAGDERPEEIVVVDQSRSPATGAALERLGQPSIVHVPSDERGLSRARNLGLGHCHGEVVAFIDDDCIPARDWIAAARRKLSAAPGCAVWTGSLVRDEGRLSGPPESPERRAALCGTGDPWHVGPTGGNSFFRRLVFDRVGLFDPELGQGSTYPGAEDGEMIFRVLSAGLEVRFSSSIRVFHVAWRDEAENEDNGYNYGMGVGAMIAKLSRQGYSVPMARMFARRFLAKYLAVPYYLLLGRRHDYRVNLRWSQGIVRGFLDWRKAHPPEARRAGWPREP